MAKRHKAFKEITDALMTSHNRTEAMYKVNLSRSRFYNYLNLMKDKGILDENYKVTEEYKNNPEEFE